MYELLTFMIGDYISFHVSILRCDFRALLRVRLRSRELQGHRVQAVPGAQHLVHARPQQEGRGQAGLQVRERQHLPGPEVHLQLPQRPLGTGGSQHTVGHRHLKK